ncbi:uncharacterized mitochondrial protein AtMg00810-like [Lactuca sativa]|uniref:uncharacterized mitochondrial protein AtMg00810-like n=1 Tax=Lactuca sativa TaxID=4236 RepID=UPI000CD8C47A|nr:uncharacterized mitochondrial protein AtMg00810-like [Lactuca sativa]
MRIMLALVASKGWEIHHLDVKSAFLHGKLQEDVYVEQPEGFVKVGCKRMAVYRHIIGDELIVIGVYVDDLIVTSSSVDIIKRFKAAMSTKFEMSDLGILRYYLGIEVYQSMRGVIVTQEAYAKKVLKDPGMSNCNPTLIPMDCNKKFTKAQDEKEVDATEYRSLVGRLRYLLQTRPDLGLSVGIVIRYMQTPKLSIMAAVQQILRYMKGTIGYGIFYPHENHGKLIGYSDSSHNADEDDGRSTTGHVFYLGKSPITWCSQKQDTVGLSSCEAEYMAASVASCQAVWLKDLIEEVFGTTQLDENSEVMNLLEKQYSSMSFGREVVSSSKDPTRMLTCSSSFVLLSGHGERIYKAR